MGDFPSSCQNYVFLGSSLFFPCSALAANLCFSWWNENLHLRWVDELQDWVSPLVCTRATFPFVSAIWAFGHSCQLVLTAVEDCLWALTAIWTFLPIASDVCLPLRTVLKHEVLFGPSCQLIPTSDYCWGLFMLGKCLFGISYRSPSKSVCNSCVSVHSFCMIGTLVDLYKMVHSGSIH